jgi:RNA-directed DNA polymerase
MKRVGNLFEELCSFPHLLAAFQRAWRGANKTIEAHRFRVELERNLFQLQEELLSGSYRHGPYHYFRILDPKPRMIAAAPFRDRVVHHALVGVLEPIYERCFIFDSYATRKGKGTHAAVMRAQQFLRSPTWYAKADVSRYFDNIIHEKLVEILLHKIKDRRVIGLVETILQSHGEDGKGLPIGNLTSQFLANVYLDPFDRYVKETLRFRSYVRYMDDFVVFAEEQDVCREFLTDAAAFLGETLGLALKPSALQVNRCSHGLGFLGMRIHSGGIRHRGANKRRSLRRLHRKIESFHEGKLDEESLVRSVTSAVGHLRYFCPGFDVALALRNREG